MKEDKSIAVIDNPETQICREFDVENPVQMSNTTDFGNN
jgi:hypothetical protein